MYLNNLAGLLQAQGDFMGARPLYERALAINEKVLGPEHPETATSLNNLARLLHDQGSKCALDRWPPKRVNVDPKCALDRWPPAISSAAKRNPTTGIVPCCAPAASGHAAATPTSVMNSRRFTRSPRRRVAGDAAALRGSHANACRAASLFITGFADSLPTEERPHRG